MDPGNLIGDYALNHCTLLPGPTSEPLPPESRGLLQHSGEMPRPIFYLFAFPLACSSQTLHSGLRFVILGSEAGVGSKAQSLVVRSTGSRIRQIWLDLRKLLHHPGPWFLLCKLG